MQIHFSTKIWYSNLCNQSAWNPETILWYLKLHYYNTLFIHFGQNLRDASHYSKNFLKCLQISWKSILSYSFVQGKISWHQISPSKFLEIRKFPENWNLQNEKTSHIALNARHKNIISQPRLLNLILLNLIVRWPMGTAIVRPPNTKYTQSIGVCLEKLPKIV